MTPPPGGTTLDWDGGDDRSVVQLSMKVAKLETFVRLMEKDIEDSADMRDRMSKVENQAETIDRRLEKVCRSLDELDDLKSAAKLINAKTLSAIIIVLLGGSLAGNATLDAVKGEPTDAKIQKVEALIELLENRDD